MTKVDQGTIVKDNVERSPSMVEKQNQKKLISTETSPMGSMEDKSHVVALQKSSIDVDLVS